MPVPMIYTPAPSGNFANQDVYIDGTDYSVVLATDNTDIATYTISKNLLSNSVYKTNNAVASFQYWYTIASTTNTFALMLDGAVVRTFTTVNAAASDYSVWLKMSPNVDHTIVIRALSITVGKVVHCQNFKLNVSAELIS